MNKPAAVYARMSSYRQKEEHTISSQIAALMQHAESHGYAVPRVSIINSAAGFEQKVISQFQKARRSE